MKSSERNVRAAADDMFSQLHPHNMVRDARDFAQKLIGDEVFRDYVAARIWITIPVFFTFILVAALCAITAMLAAGRVFPPPVPLWFLPVPLLLGGVVGFGAAVGQAYVFLIWLEEQASRKRLKARGMRVAVPRGVLAYLKYSRAVPAWVMIALCVLIPLVLLALNAPLTALLLACLSVGAPVAFMRLNERRRRR
jgi:hypothetical protein